MKRYRKPIVIVVASRTARTRPVYNPYSTAWVTLVYRDGSKVEHVTRRQYDSEDNCVHTAFRELETAGLVRGVKRNPNGNSEGPRQWCERNGVTLVSDAATVACERDLHA